MTATRKASVRISLAALVLVSAGLIAAPGAQIGTAVLEGIVEDRSKALMPGVDVTATSPESGFKATIRTNYRGAYRFQDVKPGLYVLRATLSGFQPQIYENIRLAGGQRRCFDFKLQVARPILAPEDRIDAASVSASCEKQALDVSVNPRQVLDRGLADFASGRIVESLADFDPIAGILPPAGRGLLWQRGIALYYAGRYEDCRTQIEAQHVADAGDVENAFWHFACVARSESPAAARNALLTVSPDSRFSVRGTSVSPGTRLPMRELYAMYRGSLTPDQVWAATNDQPLARFYAHFYTGLYCEVTGDDARALKEISAAAKGSGYGSVMWMVARVHLDRLLNQP